ncbi:MAG: OmpA family protein [Desulfuromonadales bacterium]|jgi:outer membrane protein OmpA-like peptidoglycan-associated protein
MKKLFLLSLVVMFLAACAPAQTNQEKGTRYGAAGGAAAGALLGQAIGGNTKGTLIGAGLGALAGGVVGNQVGKSMDEQEAAMRRELAAVEAANIQRNADVLAVTFRSDYLFDVGSANLNAGSFNEISRVSRVLNQYPDTSIQVAGHTDSTGSEQFNQTLSEQRASNVKNALVGQGVDPNRISTIGFGESAPVADNSTESGRQMNRRVVITIQPRNA